MNRALLERLACDITLASKFANQHYAEIQAKWGNNVERSSVGAMKRILDALIEEQARELNAPVEQGDLCLAAHLDDTHGDFDYHRDNGNARDGSAMLCPLCQTQETRIKDQCSVLSERGMYSFLMDRGAFEHSYNCDPQRGFMINMACANGHEWTVEIGHYPDEQCRFCVQIPEANFPELYPHLKEESNDEHETR